MKVVILCGGLGSRIRDANESLPKPMLPIGGKPIVWHIMKMYGHYGFKEFVLCLGYRSWVIKEFFLNYAAMTNDIVVKLGRERAVAVTGNDSEEDWNVVLAETGELTPTANRVYQIRKYLDPSDVFLLTYGDGVANIDLRQLLAFHQSHGRIATVTAVRPPGRFGELDIHSDLVTEFNEKPQASGGLINGGFFVFDAARIWRYIDPTATALEQEPMRRLAADQQLAAYTHTGFWQPMDTPREYNFLNDLWNSGSAPWKVW